MRTKKISEKSTELVAPKLRSHTLTPKQAAFVEARSKGMNCVQAAQAAGYAFPDVKGYTIESVPAVKAAIAKAWAANEKAAAMTKKKVMDGMLYAIDQAKLLADPTAQISGWREIAKMCGYYEPQKMKVEISVSAKRMFSQFETMSDEELLKIADTEIIDVDATEVEGENEPESE